ncbi:MAG: 3-phosphoshikimate 1-carboxyvinyltransferase [Eubacteriaceae bacterium]|nr:3-phosphoshikimate 1-carboxyvinyltransferase [Eubacteriaceae bacterium]
MSGREISLFPAGSIEAPASKSIAHRAIICSGLARGNSIIKNVSRSEDVDASIRCMASLGAGFSLKGDEMRSKGIGPVALNASDGEKLLDCGESGSTLRFLIPLAAMLGGQTRFAGRGRLMERPLGPYFSALAEHGARLELKGPELLVSGTLTPGTYNIPGNISSQFISGLLLCLPLLKQQSKIALTAPLESAPYVDLTIDAMSAFGVEIIREPGAFIVPGNQAYSGASYIIEGDYSQAAFFLVAGALGRPCSVKGLSLGSKQGDKQILAILARSGAQVSLDEAGGISVKKAGRLKPQSVDISDIPDLAAPIAALFCACEGTSYITNASRLRLKESDRLLAIATELSKLGADIALHEDSLAINGTGSLNGGNVDSWGDHRIAMMLAVAAAISKNAVTISASESVAKSYPSFWDDFEKMPIGGEL